MGVCPDPLVCQLVTSSLPLVLPPAASRYNTLSVCFHALSKSISPMVLVVIIIFLVIILPRRLDFCNLTLSAAALFLFLFGSLILALSRCAEIRSAEAAAAASASFGISRYGTFHLFVVYHPPVHYRALPASSVLPLTPVHISSRILLLHLHLAPLHSYTSPLLIPPPIS